MLKYRTLRPEELDAWYAHCADVFCESADHFRNHYLRDPEGDCDLIFVAMDGDEIAATVRVFSRKVWLFGRAVAMGGIGEVSTKPAYRRQGVAETLLRMAIDAMNARSMPVSILFGDQPLYARLGWRFCTFFLTEVPVSALPAASLSMRPLAMDDLPALMGAYDFFAGRLNGAMLRSEAYWRRWVLAEWHGETHVLMMDDRPVGYCVAHIEGDPSLLVVDELAAAPHAEAALPAFLRAVTEARGASHVRFPTPLLPGVQGEIRPVEGVMMIRLNTPILGYTDSDVLAAAMAAHAGMFPADSF